MIIKNALVFGEDKTFSQKDIFITEDHFSSDEKMTDSDTLDASGLYAIPGLIDIHFHGCMGYDFCDASSEAIHEIAKYEASIGVTSICPATMTLGTDLLKRIMQTAADYSRSPVLAEEASFIGINMEGPFISEAKKGAQASRHIQLCNVPLFQELQKDADGLIKLVDIAPENDGAIEFINTLKDDVGISLAHSTANYDVADAAYKHGARHATHLYNAMPPFSHRDPGIVGAAFDNSHVKVELICDGVHLHPATVRATFQLFGDDRIVLISDSMRATGLSDGEYTLGGQAVSVRGKYATLSEGGSLAGSVTNLMDCMRTVVKDMHLPLESAVACATMNPAKAIGIYNTHGSITNGKSADLILLDSNLDIKAIFLRGKQIL